MFQWADQTDLCLALGTSLSGLNADRLARNPAKKYSKQGECLGLVIVALQETQLDEVASLRIFALLDDVLQLLAEELQLSNGGPRMLVNCSSEIRDVFVDLPYNSEGQFIPGASLTLDLRTGARIQITNGNFANCPGIIIGKNKEGHYLLKVTMDVGEGACIEEDLLLASWWLLEATSGRISTLPVVQAS
eukprot:gnl/MRDRNA2_/MRDRNA2_177580_c0_seq1.p1 gnl/MRDRNA2_/MRDRNA2_177580_c0~~gnl/MRDRNA2_/MRDRNA2_177580_c0_seq1.p1  ORF type:complete len:190 (-),score=33.04 gnl/MRDRNA2_/MRDRNA2_177580_c0_seq1:198-767(-)